jgi:RHS repeat-associated protein
MAGALLMGLMAVPKAPSITLARGLHGNSALTSGGGVSGNVTPYSPGELWGGGSELENCSMCSPSGLIGKSGGQSTDPGQPVDPITGGYTHSESLFSVSAVGGNLAMKLTYDSGLAASERYYGQPAGYFGYGWQSTLSGAMDISGSTVSLTDENTAQTTFTRATSNDGCPLGDYADIQKYTVPDSNYAYCAANRVDAQLGYFQGYGYELKLSGGKEVDTYDVYGNLNWVGTNTSDLNGNNQSLQFAYNVTPGSVANCPVSGESSCFIEGDNADPARDVVAEVDSFGLVQQVWDPLGRGYSMFYTDGNGDLNQLQTPSPAGGVAATNFTYSVPGSSAPAPSPNDREMLTVQDPDTNTKTVGYLNGMVSSITDPFTNKDTYWFGDTDCANPTSTDCTQGVQYSNVTYADGELDENTYAQSQLISAMWGQTNNGGVDTQASTFNYTEPSASDQDAPINEVVYLPDGSHGTISTDSNGNVLAYTDPAGNTTTSMYNDSGGNNLDELCWSAPPGITVPSNASCSAPPSGSTTYTYDAYGHELSSTDPLGNTTRSGYYVNGGLLCWTAPPTATGSGAPCSGNGTGGPGSAAPSGATTYTYDAQGDVTNKTVLAAPSPNQTTTSQYNADDELQYSIPPDGQGQGGFGSNAYETSYAYEANGALASQRGPLGYTTSSTYDAAGNVLTSSDPAGVTTNSYDADNRLCWSYRGLSSWNETVCNNAPPISTRYYPGGYLANTDAPNAVEDPDGATTTYTYGDKRFPTKATVVEEATVLANPQANIFTYTNYDDFANPCATGPFNPGAVGSCQEPSGNGDAVNIYNSEGQLLTSTNGDGQTTTYGYTNHAWPTNPTSSTNPLNKTTTYFYDANGHLSSATDPEGHTVTTGYDADGRPCFEAPVSTSASCSVPPTGIGVTVLTYDQAGQRVSMADNYNNNGSGQINDAYSYDADGNLLSGSNDNGQTNTYAYNLADQVTCISYVAIANSTCRGMPSGSYVSRGYNGAGQLASTTDWLGNTITYSNYNALSEVQSIGYPASTGESLTYGYDSDGNVTRLNYNGTKIAGLAGSDSWTINADNQVGTSSSVGSYASPSDTYNPMGWVHAATNPTTTGSEPGPDTYLYQYGGSLARDTPPSGAPGGSQTISYAYNAGAQLTSITNPNNPVSTEYGSFNYTADGQRCWSDWASAVTTQACGQAPAGSTQYAWNTYGQLCFSGTVGGSASCSSTGGTTYTYDGNNLRMTSKVGSTTTQYDWDTVDGASIPLDISDGTNSYIYGPLLFGGTAPIEQISAGGNVSFVASTQTGVQAVFTGGATPTLQQLSAYSLWGTQVLQQNTTKTTPFGFQGSYTDSSGLIYLINRYYDPSTAQFISIDPEVAETGQPYAYTADDPLNRTDPLGLESQLAKFYQALLGRQQTFYRDLLQRERAFYQAVLQRERAAFYQMLLERKALAALNAAETLAAQAASGISHAAGSLGAVGKCALAVVSMIPCVYPPADQEPQHVPPTEEPAPAPEGPQDWPPGGIVIKPNKWYPDTMGNGALNIYHWLQGNLQPPPGPLAPFGIPVFGVLSYL